MLRTDKVGSMKTFLYEEHVKLKAKMVDFAGFEMPLQYSSILLEHQKVRNGCGLFDISHMGLFEVRGKDALNFLCTNHLPKEPLSSCYTIFCDEGGGCIDDLLIYKWDEERYWVIGNASNRERDWDHLSDHMETSFLSEKLGMIAIQGPESEKMMNLTLKKNHFVQQGNLVISATGYTGEKGFECIGPFEDLKKLFVDLINQGVTPCGLGCRDTLRLEMGYALYGHELSPEISPLESVAAWAVKLDKEFLGKEQAIARAKRKAYRLELLEKGVPRQGYRLFKNNREVGIVTSGTFSPTMQKGIALCLATEEPEEMEIRQQRVKVHVIH